MANSSRRPAFPLLILGLAIGLSGCSGRSSGPQVGEFTQRRESANVITAAQIEQHPGVTTVEELLIRLVPSVEYAGGGVQIRGLSGSPLWVIDGVPISTSGLVPVTPGDVARIEVLRDGGATAAYGFRGASGVILIRTRNGS